MRPFWRSTWVGVLAATCLLLAGCDKKEPEDEVPPTSTTTTTSSLDEKNLHDVTVCLMPPAVAGPPYDPDVKEMIVKADLKTRVHWKSHGVAHKLRFETWPFHDDADETVKEGDLDVYYIKVPAAGSGESRTFILKKKLEAGQRETYPYKIDLDPSFGSTVPDGPAIIGEG